MHPILFLTLLALQAIACTSARPEASCLVIASAYVAPMTVCGRAGDHVAGPFDNSNVVIPDRKNSGRIHVIETWPGDTLPFAIDPSDDDVFLRQTLETASRAVRKRGVILRPRRPSDVDYLQVKRSTILTWTQLGRSGGPQEFHIAREETSSFVAKILLNAAGLPQERIDSVDPPLPRPAAVEALAPRQAFGASLAQAARGLDRDDPTARRFLNAIPADLKLPCQGPAPAVDYCAVLDHDGPTMRDVGMAVERAFRQLIERSPTAEEMTVMLDRYEIGLRWAEQERMIALLAPGEVRLEIPSEALSVATACPIFNARFYLAANSDLGGLGVKTESEALDHWLTRGIWEGRRSSSVFHLIDYWHRNNEALLRGYDSMLGSIHHFVNFALRDPGTVAEVNALCETRTTP